MHMYMYNTCELPLLSYSSSPTSVPVVPKRKKRQTMMGPAPVEEETIKIVRIPCTECCILSLSLLAPLHSSPSSNYIGS